VPFGLGYYGNLATGQYYVSIIPIQKVESRPVLNFNDSFPESTSKVIICLMSQKEERPGFYATLMDHFPVRTKLVIFLRISVADTDNITVSAVDGEISTYICDIVCGCVQNFPDANQINKHLFAASDSNYPKRIVVSVFESLNGLSMEAGSELNLPKKSILIIGVQREI
jgi:hypothetical protein